MPLLGSEEQLASLIKQYVNEQNTALGFKPALLNALSSGIAKAIVQHLIANIQVNPGIVVTTNSGTGSTIGPGTIT